MKSKKSIYKIFIKYVRNYMVGDYYYTTLADAYASITGTEGTIKVEKNQIIFTSIPYDENSFTSLVTCNINQYKDTKSVKKTLTIPAWLNERAIAMGINFSQVLQEALLSKIQIR